MFHKIITMAVWAITAIASVLMGAWVVGFNYEMYLLPMDQAPTQFQQMAYVGFHGIVFVAGIISVIMFVMMLMGGCKKGGCSCGCMGQCKCHN